MIVFSIILIAVCVIVVRAFRRDTVAFVSTIIVLTFVWETFINKVAADMTSVVTPTIMTISMVALVFSYVGERDDDYRGLLYDPFIRLFIFTSAVLVVFAVVRGIGPLEYFVYYRRVAAGYLLLSMFLSAPPAERRREVFSFFLILLAIETGIGFVQYWGPAGISNFLSDRASYMVNGAMVVMKEEEFAGTILINGTFSRFNIFGNTLAILIVYLAACIFLRKDGDSFYSNRLKTYLIIICSIIAVFLSGNRMSVISLGVGGFVVYAYKNFRQSMILLVVAIVMLVIYSTLLRDVGETAAKTGELGFENPLERLLGVFSLLDNPFTLGEGVFTTFTLTLIMIPYFLSNPFFGAGLYFMGGYPFIFPGSENDSDATLAFLLAEFGIIGFAIFISVIVYGLVLLKKKGYHDSFRILLPVMITAGVQTVTDPGLFSKITSFLLVLMIGVEILHSRVSATHAIMENGHA